MCTDMRSEARALNGIRKKAERLKNCPPIDWLKQESVTEKSPVCYHEIKIESSYIFKRAN